MLKEHRGLRRLINVGRILVGHLISFMILDLILRRKKDPLPSRLVAILEDLGPIFVKFGQMISTQPDLLPVSFLEELERLQDRVSTFPDSEAERIIEEDLGEPPSSLFQNYHQEPVASASLAQVYKAEIPEKGSVAVKVRRPGVWERLSVDIGLLYKLARAVERIVPAARRVHMCEAVERFERDIRKELDFDNERENINLVKSVTAGQKNLEIPETYPDYCSDRILTLQWLPGGKISDKKRLLEEELDPGELADSIGQLYLYQILEAGIYHSDPHPGNIFFLGQKKIGLVDFGLIGRLEEEDKDNLTSLLYYAVKADSDGITESLVDLGLLDDSDSAAVKRELSEIIEEHYREKFRQIKMGKLLFKLLNRIVRRYDFDLPPSYLELARTAFMVENVCEGLDPNYRWTEAFKRYREGKGVLARADMGPARKEAQEFIGLLMNLPGRLDRALTMLESGSISGPTSEELERLADNVSPSGVNIALGLAVAASVISGAFLLSEGLRLVAWGLFGVGFVGFLKLLL